MTLVLVALLAVLAFFYIALPLFSSRHADPLPDETDPVLAGLNDEKSALLRAISELDERTDLAAERREQLRTRYEAKAAATLKAIDERQAELASRGRRTPVAADAPRKRRVPVAAVSLLAVAIVAAAFLPAYVLPRVGEDATITSTEMEAAQQLRELQRVADREPTVENLLNLGDAYLSLQSLPEAEAAYRRAAEAEGGDQLVVYQRLAVLAIQSDLEEAQMWLERAHAAAPDDAETLFLLSEVAYANGDMVASEEALTRFVDVSGGETNDMVAARLELFDRVDELTAAAEQDPSETNLAALADLYWRAGDTQGAAGAYLRLLTEVEAQHPVALSRMGEAMMASGAPNDAAALIERSASVSGGLESVEPSAVLTLGEAYLQTGRFEDSVNAIETYLAMVGDDANPVAAELLTSARRSLQAAGGVGAGAGGVGGSEAGGAEGAAEAGGVGAGSTEADLLTVGAAVFAQNCAECHAPGAGGQVIGTVLEGNPRAANEGNVRDAVTFGRGRMPGFGASLTDTELDAVTRYVVDVVSQR